MLPSTVPINTLEFTSSMIKFNLVRILPSLLTSDIAAFMAGFATLPITESKVKTAPMFTAAGLWQLTKPLAITHIETNSRRITSSFISLYSHTHTERTSQWGLHLPLKFKLLKARALTNEEESRKRVNSRNGKIYET